jgi:hypothetical protein
MWLESAVRVKKTCRGRERSRTRCSVMRKWISEERRSWVGYQQGSRWPVEAVLVGDSGPSGAGGHGFKLIGAELSLENTPNSLGSF